MNIIHEGNPGRYHTSRCKAQPRVWEMIGSKCCWCQMVLAIGTRERVGGATAHPRRGAAASFTSPLAQRLSRSLSRDAGRREQRNPTFLIVDATSPDTIHLKTSRHHQNRIRFDCRDHLWGREVRPGSGKARRTPALENLTSP